MLYPACKQYSLRNTPPVQPIRQRVQREHLVLAAGVGRLAHHNTLIQILGPLGGFHAIWIDREHGSLSIEGLEVATFAARNVGLDNFIRIRAAHALFGIGHRGAWRLRSLRPTWGALERGAHRLFEPPAAGPATRPD